MSETGRYTRGTGVLRLFTLRTSSNPVDVGWGAVRIHTFEMLGGRVVNFGQGLRSLGLEVVVKVYGVAMTMPQG